MKEGMPNENKPRWSAAEVMHEFKGAFVLSTFVLQVLGVATHFEAGRKLWAEMPDAFKWQLVIPAGTQNESATVSIGKSPQSSENRVSFQQSDGGKVEILIPPVLEFVSTDTRKATPSEVTAKKTPKTRPLQAKKV